MVSRFLRNGRWGAPGPLELVRRFLNTWDYSIAARRAEDRLPPLLKDRRAWEAAFPGIRRPAYKELGELNELRAGLRGLVETEVDAKWLNSWLGRYPLSTRVELGDRSSPRLERRPDPAGGAVSQFLAIVVDAIDEATWSRLKTCPDCKLVFFDRSRNQSRRWCGMYGGPGGRACGSIAKVRSWRARTRPKRA